ncbi:hypothetical protein ILYODFUR_022206 [Ilyodon furcidens]|uniref:Uncharacterized protein n=1 Tax=Ilyodon furcidens TaxID=33524 RepID=A0ABV0T2V5_9TELE
MEAYSTLTNHHHNLVWLACQPPTRTFACRDLVSASRQHLPSAHPFTMGGRAENLKIRLTRSNVFLVGSGHVLSVNKPVMKDDSIPSLLPSYLLLNLVALDELWFVKKSVVMG